MKKTLLALALAFATFDSARAEVLIYKGKATLSTIPGTGLPPKLNGYLVLDVAAQQVGFIPFFKSGDQKLQLPGAPFGLTFDTAQAEGGGTMRILVDGSADTSAPPNYDFTVTFFRGLQKNIVVADKIGQTTRNEPRVLKGVGVLANRGGGSSLFQDLRLELLFQSKLTIKSNNNTRTLEQTLADIADILKDEGFKNP